MKLELEYSNTISTCTTTTKSGTNLLNYFPISPFFPKNSKSYQCTAQYCTVPGQKKKKVHIHMYVTSVLNKKLILTINFWFLIKKEMRTVRGFLRLSSDMLLLTLIFVQGVKNEGSIAPTRIVLKFSNVVHWIFIDFIVIFDMISSFLGKMVRLGSNLAN